VSERSIGWSFVLAQAFLIGALVVTPSGDDFNVADWLRSSANAIFWLGVALAVAAGITLGRSLTATPVPAAGARLRTTGPYRFVRHPIYTGVVLIVVAMAVRSGSFSGLILGLATIVFFHWKASWEEQRLRERFPGYADYASRTPRFLPRLVVQR
jgi:protein-S-isoprenylcysteine O-methyltransferase Ste14